MTTSLCPIATVNAALERTWNLLVNPESYALWWDARTRAIIPPGPARPGQRIQAESGAFGRRWDVTITVEAVDEARHNLRLTTRLPLGITVYNSITCTLLDPASCRISFG
jgi:uncharacterized protein YndB with AHSA1/START domain